MAQAQAVKPKTMVKEVTQTQSLAVMKNLVRASISEVCFLRNLFPEDCFKSASFGNTTVRALMPRESAPTGEPGAIINEDAARLVAWQDAAFEALALGYLRSIVFSIFSSEEDPADRKLLESYVYSFRYPTDEEIQVTLENDGKAFTASSIRDQAISMVRSLIRLCETMRPVPEERVISLKLFYYDDRTPEDYQPTYFSDATHEEHPFFAEAPLKVVTGTAASRHHSLTLKVAFQEDAMPEGGLGEDSDGLLAQEATAAAAEEALARAEASTPVTGGPGSLPVPAGVDPELYARAVQLLTGPGGEVLASIKALTDALAAGSAAGVAVEQTKRILRHAAAEGLVVPLGKTGSKYELAPAVREAAAAHAAAADGEAQSSSDAAGDATSEAATAFARALVQVVQTWGADEGLTHVTVPMVGSALGLESEYAKALVEALETEGVLGPAAKGGRGRPIRLGSPEIASKLQLAVGYLSKHGLAHTLPPSLSAAPAEAEGHDEETPSAQAEVEEEEQHAQAAPAPSRGKRAAAEAVQPAVSPLAEAPAVMPKSKPAAKAAMPQTLPKAAAAAMPAPAQSVGYPAADAYTPARAKSSYSLAQGAALVPSSVTQQTVSGAKRKFAPAHQAAASGGLEFATVKAARTAAGGKALAAAAAGSVRRGVRDEFDAEWR